MKENGMVSKSTFIDINESGKFCLCVAMICRHKCTGKETFTSRSDNTVDSWNSRFYILYPVILYKFMRPADGK